MVLTRDECLTIEKAFPFCLITTGSVPKTKVELPSFEVIEGWQMIDSMSLDSPHSLLRSL